MVERPINIEHTIVTIVIQMEFIIMKCLEKKLSDRYRDMTLVLQALNRIGQ